MLALFLQLHWFTGEGIMSHKIHEGGGYGSLPPSACMGFRYKWDVIIQKVSDANRAYSNLLASNVSFRKSVKVGQNHSMAK